MKVQRTDISARCAGLAILAITLLGAALRFYHLGFSQLWVDESFSAWVSTHNLRDILYICQQDIVHPPLYYFLLSFWTPLAGHSETALRFVSAGVSLLGVPLLYRLGRRGWSRRTGLTAALLWASSPFAVWYAQETRMYALLTVVGMAALLCLAQALPRGSRRWLLANAALNLVGLYTHYFYLFLLLAQCLYLVLTLRRHRRAFWSWVLANSLTAALYAPWSLALLSRGFQGAGISWIAPLSAETLLRTFWQLGAGYHRLVDLPSAVVTIVLVIGLVSEAVFGRSQHRSAIPGLAWMSLVAAPLLIALISLRVPLFYSRFLQIILPVYLLLAAAGLMRLVRPAVGAALVAVVVLLGGLVLQEMYSTSMRYKQDWQGAMHDLAARVEPGDALAFRGGQGWHAYWYYYQGPPLVGVDLAPEEGVRELAARAGDAARVWLVLWDPAAQCELLAQFVPAGDDPLEIRSTACYPEVLVVAYAWRGQSR